MVLCSGMAAATTGPYINAESRTLQPSKDLSRHSLKDCLAEDASSCTRGKLCSEKRRLCSTETQSSSGNDENSGHSNSAHLSSNSAHSNSSQLNSSHLNPTHPNSSQSNSSHSNSRHSNSGHSNSGRHRDEVNRKVCHPTLSLSTKNCGAEGVQSRNTEHGASTSKFVPPKEEVKGTRSRHGNDYEVMSQRSAASAPCDFSSSTTLLDKIDGASPMRQHQGGTASTQPAGSNQKSVRGAHTINTVLKETSSTVRRLEKNERGDGSSQSTSSSNFCQRASGSPISRRHSPESPRVRSTAASPPSRRLETMSSAAASDFSTERQRRPPPESAASQKLKQFRHARAAGRTICVCDAAAFWERERVAIQQEKTSLKEESLKLREEAARLRDIRVTVRKSLLESQTLRSNLEEKETLIKQKEENADSELKRLESRAQELRLQREKLDADRAEWSRMAQNLETSRRKLHMQETELSNREKVLQRATQRLEQREIEVAQRESSLLNEEEELESRKKELEQRSQDADMRAALLEQQSLELTDALRKVDMLQEELADRRAELSDRENKLKDDTAKLNARQVYSTEVESRLKEMADDLCNEKSALDSKSASLYAAEVELARKNEDLEKKFCEKQQAMQAKLEREEAELIKKLAEIKKKETEVAAETNRLNNEKKELESRSQSMEAEKSTLEKTKVSLNQLQTQIDGQQAALLEKEKVLNVVENDLKQRQRELEEWDARLSKAAASLTASETAAKDLQQQLHSKAAEVDKQRQEISRRETAVEMKEAYLQERERSLHDEQARSQWHQAVMREVADERERLQLERTTFEWEKNAVEKNSKRTAAALQHREQALKQQGHRLQIQEQHLLERERELKRQSDILMARAAVGSTALFARGAAARDKPRPSKMLTSPLSFRSVAQRGGSRRQLNFGITSPGSRSHKEARLSFPASAAVSINLPATDELSTEPLSDEFEAGDVAGAESTQASADYRFSTQPNIPKVEKCTSHSHKNRGLPAPQHVQYDTINSRDSVRPRNCGGDESSKRKLAPETHLKPQITPDAFCYGEETRDEWALGSSAAESDDDEEGWENTQKVPSTVSEEVAELHKQVSAVSDYPTSDEKLQSSFRKKECAIRRETLELEKYASDAALHEMPEGDENAPPEFTLLQDQNSEVSTKRVLLESKSPALGTSVLDRRYHTLMDATEDLSRTLQSND